MASSLNQVNKYDGILIAQVKNNVDPNCEGRIQVYIQKIMPDEDFDTDMIEDEEVEVTNDSILNDNGEDTKIDSGTVNITNGLWVRPVNGYVKVDSGNSKHTNKINSGTFNVPSIGQLVFIFFLDGNPGAGYYFPFTPTQSGDVMSDSITASNSGDFKDPEYQANMKVMTFPDGSSIELNCNNSSLTINVATTSFTGNVNINGNLNVKGNTVINGNLTVQGVNILSELKNKAPINHTH